MPPNTTLTAAEHAYIARTVKELYGRPLMVLTVAQYAELTGQHPQRVSVLCAQGAIPCTQARKGAPYKIHLSALAPYVLDRAAA